MKLPFKLAVDHYVGGSLAWCLNILCQACSKVMVRDHSLKTAPRAVLLLKFLGFGSIVRSAFLMPALKERFPEAKIYFATFQGCAPVVRMYPEIDRVIVVRDSSLPALAIDTFKLIYFAWKHKVDLVVDLEVHSKYSSVVSGLIAARDRAGFAGITSRFRKGLYTHLVFWNPIRSIAHAYRQLGEALGLRSSELLYPPVIPQKAHVELSAFLKKLGVSDTTLLLGINPNASDLRTERRWPIESFAAVLNALPPAPNLVALIVGSPSERSYCDLLSKLCSDARVPVHNIAGSLSFAAFTALLERLNLLLTNDTGPLHLAAALDTPTISLWGPTDPAVYSPGGPKHIAFYESIYCSPCAHASDLPPCGGDNRCLKQLGWLKVYGAVARTLRIGEIGAENQPIEPGSKNPADGNIVYGYWKRPDVPLPIHPDNEDAAIHYGSR